MFRSRTATGISLSLICLLILGTMPIISNSRPEDFDALSFAFLLSFWQLIFATPLFFGELRYKNKGIFSQSFAPKMKRRVILVILGTGGLFGLSTYFYVFGIEKAGAVSAAIAMQAYPLFAILWETLFLKRRKNALEMALTLVLLGSLYYLGTGGTGMIDGFSPWFLLALGVPFLWSVAHVIIREELGRSPITPAQITFFRVIISTIFLGIVLLISQPTAFQTIFSRTDFQVFAIVMGLVYYIELIIWFYAMRNIDVSLASSITTPWPALTMVLAVIFLGEPVAPYQIIAFIAIIACVYGLMIASIRKEASASA